jgi:hypothetical protein
MYASELQPAEGTTDEKTVAVLNEMLASLQQSPVIEKKDEAAPLSQPHVSTVAKDEAVFAEKTLVSDQVASVPLEEKPTSVVSTSPTPIQESSATDVSTQIAVVPAVDVSTQKASVLAVNAPLVATGEEVKSIEEEKINEKVGIDTLNLPDPQGNWLYKSIWYERAQERYENIRKLVDLIWDFKSNFTEKRAELDRSVLDPFYISLGLRIGELQEVLSNLVEKFDVERKKDGDLNVQERSLLQEVKAEQVLIETLHSQVKTVTELDHRVDDALDPCI